MILLAFGIPKTPGTRKEYEADRLAMEELCAYKEQPKTWVCQILEAARLAPSAWNTQPWRFVVYQNRVHLFSRKPLEKKGIFDRKQELNFGVMLANVMVAAEQIWVDIDFIRLENITQYVYAGQSVCAKRPSQAGIEEDNPGGRLFTDRIAAWKFYRKSI